MDDDEFEYDNDFERESDGGCKFDRACNDFEVARDLGRVSRFCVWYSDGMGKYACRGDRGDWLRSLPKEYRLLWDMTVLVRVGICGVLCGV